MFFLLCFFFFKQKTAYEMRISDWSSDVCSSDLLLLFARQALDRGILRDKSLQYGSGRQPLSRDRLYRRSGRRRARDHQLQTTPYVWRAGRSEERRGRNGCVSTCRYRWSHYQSKNKCNNYETAVLHIKVPQQSPSTIKSVTKY